MKTLKKIIGMVCFIVLYNSVYGYDSEKISRTFNWNYSGKTWKWEIELKKDDYEYYRGLSRH